MSVHLKQTAGLAVAVLAIGVAGASGQVARFENFSVGPKGTNFTDPVSGIRFHSPRAGLSFQIAENSASALLPLTSPGRYLAATSAGNAGSVPWGGPYGWVATMSDFSFSMEMPSSVPLFQMDVIYHSYMSNLFEIRAYDASNSLLHSQVFIPSSLPNLHEATYRIERPTADIRKIEVVSAQRIYSAYDNIIIPEPLTTGIGLGVLAPVAVLLLPLRRRR